MRRAVMATRVDNAALESRTDTFEGSSIPYHDEAFQSQFFLSFRNYFAWSCAKFAQILRLTVQHPVRVEIANFIFKITAVSTRHLAQLSPFFIYLLRYMAALA
jgi:hypothetical protein